jgi:hypothetical protein
MSLEGPHRERMQALLATLGLLGENAGAVSAVSAASKAPVGAGRA